MKKEDLRIRKTKNNLYKSLLQLMEEMPFEDIKVTDICNKAMINRSTFYDHYNDKYELLIAITETIKEEIQTTLKTKEDTKNIKEYFLECLKLLMQSMHENLDIYSTLAIIKKINNSVAYDMIFNAFIEEANNTLNKKYVNRSTIPNETITLFCISGVMKVLMEEILDVENFDEERIINQFEILLPNLDFIEKID